MKKIILMLMLCCANAYAANGTTVVISGKNAQAIYHAMTKVTEDGAAGHIYKKGKNILCIRINADMDDAQGKPVPQEDPSRYHCNMNVDVNGVTSPGKE